MAQQAADAADDADQTEQGLEKSLRHFLEWDEEESPQRSVARQHQEAASQFSNTKAAGTIIAMAAAPAATSATTPARPTIASPVTGLAYGPDDQTSHQSERQSSYRTKCSSF